LSFLFPWIIEKLQCNNKNITTLGREKKKKKKEGESLGID
jgi:hypothetical protein